MLVDRELARLSHAADDLFNVFRYDHRLHELHVDAPNAFQIPQNGVFTDDGRLSIPHAIDLKRQILDRMLFRGDLLRRHPP